MTSGGEFSANVTGGGRAIGPAAVPPMLDAGRDGQSILDVKDLSKVFGGLVAVNNVSFSIPEGKVTAMIGPNGAGKTTTFNLVAGAFPPTGGQIWFKNRKINGLGAHEIAQIGIARTFQNVQLFANMSVIENVMVGRHSRSKSGFVGTALRFPAMRREERLIHEEAREKLAFVGLQDRAFDEPLSLPFGQQKLLEIARALAVEPQLLLLDEPAGGLSGQEIDELARRIETIVKTGITVMLVEHRMQLVMGVADKIIVLNYGEKLAEGTRAEIRGNQAVISAYLGTSFA